MAWKVTVLRDTELPTAGTATATFTDDKTGEQIYSITHRVDVNDAKNDLGEFIRAARDGLAKEQEAANITASIAQKIEGALNG